MIGDDDTFFDFIKAILSGTGVSSTTRKSGIPVQKMEVIVLDGRILMIQDLTGLWGCVLGHKLISEDSGQRSIFIFSEDGKYKKTINLSDKVSDDYDFHFTNGVLEIILKRREISEELWTLFSFIYLFIRMDTSDIWWFYGMVVEFEHMTNM